MNADPDLAGALRIIVDKIDANLRTGGYSGEPVKMFLAGGLAAHYYTRDRYTHDVDASFSHRIALPYKELIANFTANGERSVLFFDQNYNPDFALMHPDYHADAREWEGIGNDQRMVKLYVLSPVDLAVSKISRFSEQDRLDIQALARTGALAFSAFRQRATEALDYYIGNKTALLQNLEAACRDIARFGPESK